MQEMDVLAVDVGRELRMSIDPLLRRPPVIPVPPVVVERADVRLLDAVIDIAGELIGPARTIESIAQVVEVGLWGVERGRISVSAVLVAIGSSLLVALRNGIKCSVPLWRMTAILSSMGSSERPMSGRQAQARRNDPLIREAAREIFTSTPDAPMSAVAARAGVGISALYRRYASKEDLLREIARDGFQQYLDEAEAAVADGRDPWTAFEAFMERLLEAQTVAIAMNLAGTFAPDAELIAMAGRAAEINERIVERTKAGEGSGQMSWSMTCR